MSSHFLPLLVTCWVLPCGDVGCLLLILRSMCVSAVETLLLLDTSLSGPSLITPVTTLEVCMASRAAIIFCRPLAHLHYSGSFPPAGPVCVLSGGWLPGPDYQSSGSMPPSCLPCSSHCASAASSLSSVQSCPITLVRDITWHTAGLVVYHLEGYVCESLDQLAFDNPQLSLFQPLNLQHCLLNAVGPRLVTHACLEVCIRPCPLPPLQVLRWMQLSDPGDRSCCLLGSVALDI